MSIDLARDLSSVKLDIEEINPSKLLRISRYESGEPHFSKSGLNRFDTPDGSFGTCYFGLTLACAFAETVLHDRTAVSGGFPLVYADLEQRWVVRFKSADKLRLATFRGASLKKLGADGRVSTEVPYGVPQAWSKALHDHPENIDGFTYQSRHLNTEPAVVLFDRCSSKLTCKPGKYKNFLDYPGALRELQTFNVWLTA
ncbi:RES family NAD+ phosphorylase [Paraburkholderia pallida]|uniref:RES domain-containing protein n=1 Tax=Paraburkholderia pallida TaxID=2547399 RepID=A0A4P7D5U3_9BURK|nr:RES family NAD+ phosphorylase [Paraburkholderia pallida]QBR04191.1 RES domain-containing protein [Paraburkholderia pallida]